jgi:hypothetical protein
MMVWKVLGVHVSTMFRQTEKVLIEATLHCAYTGPDTFCIGRRNEMTHTIRTFGKILFTLVLSSTLFACGGSDEDRGATTAPASDSRAETAVSAPGDKDSAMDSTAKMAGDSAGEAADSAMDSASEMAGDMAGEAADSVTATGEQMAAEAVESAKANASEMIDEQEEKAKEEAMKQMQDKASGYMKKE